MPLVTFHKIWFSQFPPGIPPTYRYILETYSFYFRSLNEKNKLRFKKRLFILLKHLDFRPKGLDFVSPEMKIVIGSTIIQATFGLKAYVPRNFKTIYVVPRAYMLTGFDKPLLGHVDTGNKVMVLSWLHVQGGFKIADDAVNVALHEVAHSLDMENKISLFNIFFSQKSWKAWEIEAKLKLEVIRKNENKFFNSYGGQNLNEMFAVCLENFFERPFAFKKHLPELFVSLVKLMKQDPCFLEDPLSVNV